MKTHVKKHNNDTALKKHVEEIAQLGGLYSVNGKTVTYQLSGKKGKPKKYNTYAKRLKTVRKVGNIITFKKPFRWMGTEYLQIISQGIRKQQGHFKIVGSNRDSDWYDSMEDLIEAIDWDKMEGWHEDEIERNY